MKWTSNLTHEAEKQLQHLPRPIQKRIARAIDELEEDPFSGDVLPLKGKQWAGWYRKRVGRYRIIFLPHAHDRILEVTAILVMDEKTYR